MVKEIVYCDRCNKEVVYPIRAKVKLYTGKKIRGITMIGNDRIDLCQSCIDSLSDWLHKKEN